MGKYKVTLIETGIENLSKTVITLAAHPGEDPGEKAKDAYVKLGWNVIRKSLKVEQIEKL